MLLKKDAGGQVIFIIIPGCKNMAKEPLNKVTKKIIV